jgi:hypothetical protein
LFREPTDRDAESCATLVDRENERGHVGAQLGIGRKIFLYVSRDDDAFAILCSEGGVDTTPFKR